MAALRGKIQHVIFIMKENRTYDQVLGDLPGANGDPRLRRSRTRSHRIITSWRDSS